MTTSEHGLAAAEPSDRVRTAPLLAVILTASFIELVDVTIVAVAAPHIEASLGASPSQLQWVVAAYALALGAALITGGRLGDAYGHRPAFLLGLGAFVATSAAAALAPTPEALIGTGIGCWRDGSTSLWTHQIVP